MGRRRILPKKLVEWGKEKIMKLERKEFLVCPIREVCKYKRRGRICEVEKALEAIRLPVKDVKPAPWLSVEEIRRHPLKGEVIAMGRVRCPAGGFGLVDVELKKLKETGELEWVPVDLKKWRYVIGKDGLVKWIPRRRWLFFKNF